MALIHRYTLVCDEIRQENNGKFIILGLYTPGIELAGFPARLPKLTFFNYMEVTGIGEWDLSFRFTHAATGAMAAPEGRIKVQIPQIAGPLILPLVVPNVQLQLPGDYLFTITGGNFDGAAVTIPVTQRQVTRIH